MPGAPQAQRTQDQRFQAFFGRIWLERQQAFGGGAVNPGLFWEDMA